VATVLGEGMRKNEKEEVGGNLLFLNKKAVPALN
jgi:hypothetical protein